LTNRPTNRYFRVEHFYDPCSSDLVRLQPTDKLAFPDDKNKQSKLKTEL